MNADDIIRLIMARLAHYEAKIALRTTRPRSQSRTPGLGGSTRRACARSAFTPSKRWRACWLRSVREGRYERKQ